VTESQDFHFFGLYYFRTVRPTFIVPSRGGGRVSALTVRGRGRRGRGHVKNSGRDSSLVRSRGRRGVRDAFLPHAVRPPGFYSLQVGFANFLLLIWFT